MAFGQALGCGFADGSPRFVPSEVHLENSREDVIAVYAGQNRSAVVLESSKVFAWGEWFTGTKQLKPKEIPLPTQQSVKKLAIGKMFMMALTSFGRVYAMGDNTYGELGLSREVKNAFQMVQVGALVGPQFVDIAAGARHGMLLSSEGKVFAFGDNSEGQCGVEASRVYSPSEVPTRAIIAKARPDKIFCGESHSAMVTSDGELFMWGDNTAGRLGIKGGMSIARPRIVEDVMGKYIVAVGCGGIFNAILVGPAEFSDSANRNQNVVEVLAPPK